MSDKIYLGPNAADLDYDDKASQITRVNLSVDSDHMYTSGDDTGRTLEVSCPWGTQAMADSILAKVGAVEYRPYTADKALLDPAAEIGDGITVGGIYSVLATASASFDKQCAVTIEAPYTDEIDDEYPYQTPQQRAVARQLAQTRSLISKTSTEILLKVESEIEGLSSSIDVQLDSITTSISGLESDYSSLEQYVDSITLSVSNGSTSSTISLKAGSTTISSQSISFSGMVTFSDLSTAGGTTINGSNITTGTLYADYIKLYGNLSVYTTKTGSTVGGYLGYTSSTLDGGAGIHIMNAEGTGEFRVTGNGAAMEGPGGAKVVCTSNCNISGDYIYFNVGSGCEIGSNYLAPQSTWGMYCGLSGQRWATVYCGSVDQSSDRTLKSDIVYGLEKYRDFFLRLKPCSYQFDPEQSGATHIGLIAQDVAEALAAAGLSLSDFAGLHLSDKPGESGLSYTEFIPMLIYMFQELYAYIMEDKS